ncbi:MAG: hypothetical protein KDH93_21365 [Rhodoferax sp.]|nr:hypothetical protein [Rhodoferax sp.]MCW5628109.1 hypothetical protein [Rhodoferax sp.]MCW5643455.1 hypothetical protein [Rhodoferax sp.]
MAMRLLAKTYWSGSWVRFREPVAEFARCEQVTVYAHDNTQVRGLFWRPLRNPRPRVAVIAAHPRGDFSQHYAFPALLRAGYACLGANLRNTNNDSTCVHELLLLDLAAHMVWLREQGIDQVVWLGNSGGGSLGGFYQSQAKAAPAQRISHTPAGRPVALAQATLPAFDAFMISAAHVGQGLIMNDIIDPSVVDEHDPLLVDDTLDMYNPDNGFQPAPQWSRYTPEFLARYRAAQLARVARIDARAHAIIADQAAAEGLRGEPGFAALPASGRRAVNRRAAFQPVMTVYRTMANPNYVDNTLDPSNRGYGSLLSDLPDLMNYQLYGFGRIVTPDAWLSTWSGLSSNANFLKTGRAIDEPVAVVQAGRDMDVYPQQHGQAILETVRSQDKTLFDFPDCLHYFEPDEGEDPNAPVLRQMAALVPWLEQRLPL